MDRLICKWTFLKMDSRLRGNDKRQQTLIIKGSFMIKHIVLFSFKKNFTEKNINDLFLKLSNLKISIPQIQSFSYGKNNSLESLNQHYDYGMTMDFESEKDRDIYVNHIEHVKIIKDIILPNLNEKENAVLVLDYKFE